MTVPAFSDGAFAEFLEDITPPFMSRDFARWRKRMRLPFSMVTAEGPITLSTDDDLRGNFELYLAAVDNMGLDLVHREPLGAEPCEDGTVLAAYRTHLMNGLRHVADPYTSTVLLHPDPDGWRMSAILNARGHHEWTGRHPTDTGD